MGWGRAQADALMEQAHHNDLCDVPGGDAIRRGVAKRSLRHPCVRRSRGQPESENGRVERRGLDAW